MVIRQSPFVDRDNFGADLNDRGLVGSAVEVGTHRGEFARVLLDRWQGKMLYLVDPYDTPPGYEAQVGTLGGNDRVEDYEQAVRALTPHLHRTGFLRVTSLEAQLQIKDGSLDFVYVDGDHRREMVALDLAHWWPKVKPGGLLAGHDIVCPGEAAGGWGREIQPAVFDFCARRGLDVWLVIELQCLPWSYYVEKPKE